MCDITIRQLDPKTIPFKSVMVMLGMRESGKSTTIKDILANHRTVPRCTVMSGTEDANPFFKNFMPLSFIRTDIEESVLQEVLKRQVILKTSKETFLASGKKDKSDKIDPRAALILDDCVGKNKSLFRSKTMAEVFMNGRHFDLMVLVSLQYCVSIHPDLRTNVNYVFIFSEPRRVERKRIWNAFGTIIPDFELFSLLMDRYTCNFGCLIIKISKSPNIEDCVFHYKGNLNTPSFKIGDPVYWKKDEINRSKMEARNLERAEKVFSALTAADTGAIDAVAGTSQKGSSKYRIHTA